MRVQYVPGSHREDISQMPHSCEGGHIPHAGVTSDGISPNADVRTMEQRSVE